MIAAPKRAHISFGTFQVDLESGEIRKAGLRVRLPGQPFRVLTTLLARPGEVVTREELQREIWGANTTVDFERGIASAINKLRDALGDSAENPRYIETLARRGYRFIAPVQIEPIPLPPKPPELLEPVHAEPAVAAIPFVPSPALSAQPAAHVQDAAFVSERKGPAKVATPWLRPALATAVVCALLLVLAGGAVIQYRAERSTVLHRPPHIEQLTDSSLIYSGPPNPENLLTLATDGPRIYVPAFADGRSQISTIDLSGMQFQPINLPDELSSVSIADISRDGSKLLVRSRRSRESELPLWIVPTTGSSALRVGEILAHDATWMPSGNSVLFASGDDLSIAELDTGTVSVYARLQGRAFWPRWSPDARTLRFTMLDPVTHTSSLWELAAKARTPHPLVFGELKGMSLCCGSWTSDGSTYVFQSTDNRESNIWAVGTGAHPQLTELTNGPLPYMAPLPDRENKTLYFVGLEQPSGTRLYDQTQREFMPAPAFLAHAERVTYSRDGLWVAWTDTNGRLWRARSSDGSGRFRLTGDDLDVFLAHWSPNNQQLVLMARKPGESWQIYTVSATGGAPQVVLNDARNLADPDWSGDGRQIVFGREPDLMGKESGPHNIQILDTASHAVHVLPGSEDLFSPRWSPDGRYIAALSRDQTALLLFDTQNQKWRTLFNGSAADPVWSPDSKAVYLHAFADRNSAILRVSIDGITQAVADLSALGLPSVDNYFFGGVTPAGSPIIEPRVGTGNLYSVALPSGK